MCAKEFEKYICGECEQNGGGHSECEVWTCIDFPRKPENLTQRWPVVSATRVRSFIHATCRDLETIPPPEEWASPIKYRGILLLMHEIIVLHRPSLSFSSGRPLFIFVFLLVSPFVTSSSVIVKSSSFAFRKNAQWLTRRAFLTDVKTCANTCTV